MLGQVEVERVAAALAAPAVAASAIAGGAIGPQAAGSTIVGRQRNRGLRDIWEDTRHGATTTRDKFLWPCTAI